MEVNRSEEVKTEIKKEKKNNANKYLVVIIILLLLLMGVGGWHLLNNKEVSEFEQKVNAITEIDYSKQQEALNQLVEEGMINIQYSLSAVFNGKVSESFNVKNIKNNHHPIVFKIFDEEGNQIYESKQIALGYEINSIELDKELSKGTHQCKIQIGYATEGNVSSTFPITIEVK